jgi:hypothetical protein
MDRYRLSRRSGLLPPLRFVGKRIGATAGETTVLGVLRLRFVVLDQGPRIALRYRRPLAMLVDYLEPIGDGAFHGVATAWGRRYGTFEARPDREASADRDQRSRR